MSALKDNERLMQFKITMDIHEAIKAEAERRYMPMSVLVRQLLRRAIVDGFKIQ